MSLRIVLAVPLVLLVGACSQPGTSTRDRLAVTTPSVVGVETPQAAVSGQDVERPNRGHFVFNVDHIQVPAACSPSDGAFFCPTVRSTFDGRCSLSSNFIEFGEGVGEMTHAGLSRVTWSHCTRVSATHEITFRDGRMTMETANGDELTFTYGAGALSLVGDGVHIDSPIVVSGGTARFAGASGEGALHGEAPGATPGDLVHGKPFEATLSGTITYAPGRGGQ